MVNQALVNSFIPQDDLPPSANNTEAKSSSSSLKGNDLVNSFIPEDEVQPSAPEKSKTKQYKDTTTSDVAKSLGSGIELGAAQMLGLPGDIARAGRWAKEGASYYAKKGLEHYGYLPEGTADEDWKAVEEARQSPDRGWVGPLPSSEVTEAAAKKYLPGANYEPESRGGAFAHTIGEFAPTVLGGEGSAIKKLGTAVIAGAGSEAAGQATEGSPYESIARVGGALLSPFAAEKTLSRPLGSVGSALGVSDETLGAVGLKSGNMAAYDKVVSEGSRLKNLGVLGGLSEDNIKAIVAQEMRDGVRPSNSIITSASALSDSPSDVIRAFIKNSSLENPKVRAEVQKLVGNIGRASDTADMTATRILNDMQDEASVNALNAHRLINGLPADITEAPTANRLRSVADEVKEGAWDRLVQPAYDDHKAVNNDLIFDKLTKIDKNNPNLIFDAQEIYNSRLENRGENPITFLTKDQNGTYKNFGYVGDNGTVKGAPLEFLDILQKQLYKTNDEIMRSNAKKIEEGIDQYFAKKGLPNELKAAKDAHGDIRSQGNAIAAGMNFITDGAYQTNPAKRQAFLGRWNKLDDVEKGLYQSGVLHQIKETLGQGQQGYKNWNKILQNADNRQLLQEILNFRPKGAPAQVGASNYERFSNALDVAQAFKKEHVNNILMSTPESRTFLGRILGMGDRSLFDVMLHTAYRGAFSPELGTITALSGGLGYIRQVFADRRALKMLQMFNSKDPQFAMQLSRDIATHKEAKTSWQKVKALLDFTDKATINFYRRASIAANSQQPQQRKEGGRVGYGPGGEVDTPDDAPQYPNRKVSELGFYSKAGEALRGFPNQGKQQEIAKILKTLYDRHDVHPDEMRYTGITTPESSRGNIQLSDTFGGMGEMSPADLAEHIENQQPKMLRTELGKFGTPGRTNYNSLAMENPHLSDYREDVYHFPEKKMDKSLEWQANPTKWTVHRDEHDNANVHDENGNYVDYVNQKFSDDEAIRMVYDELANYKEDKTKSGLNFTEPHFGGTENLNKSGWMRHNVATFPPSEQMPNGAKFKNIEELQPQRAQKAEKLGLNTEPYNPNKEDELRNRWKEARAAEDKGMTAAERKLYGGRADALRKQYFDYMNNHSNSYGAVADAPYANSVEASTKRYVRQILADAVKEGMDGVSITPWYRNAERSGARPINQIELTHDTDRSNQPTTQLTVVGHNVHKDIGLFPRHDRLTDDDMEKLHSFFGKQTTKRILEAMQGSNKKRSDVVMTSLDEEDPLMYSPGGNGHVIDGHRYYYRDYLPRVLEKEARQIDPNMKAQGLFRLADSKGWFGNKMGTHHGVAFSKKFIKAAKAGGFRSFKQGGEVERPKRATGGRIPEVDKLFKTAKKELDNSTKPMLNMHDDVIVNALRIAQGRV
jgi:hypothetical protein